jgi:hypothetical protein
MFRFQCSVVSRAFLHFAAFALREERAHLVHCEGFEDGPCTLISRSAIHAGGLIHASTNRYYALELRLPAPFFALSIFNSLLRSAVARFSNTVRSLVNMSALRLFQFLTVVRYVSAFAISDTRM